MNFLSFLRPILFAATVLFVSVLPSRAQQPKKEATVWMAHTLSSRQVNIGQGENRGRVVTYHNVVRSFAAVGKFSGEPLSLRLPIKGQPGENSDGIVVWVQIGEMGKIYGVAQIKLPLKNVAPVHH